MDVSVEIDGLERDLRAFRRMLIEATSTLRILADEMDKVKRDVGISKLAGTGASLVGGILATVGFGLSFVTFGASFGLVIAGGVIGGAGGVTVGGAFIGDTVEYRKRKAQAEKLVEEMNKKADNLKEKCYRMSKLISASYDIESKFPNWIYFWSNMFFGSVKVGWNTAWGVIKNSVTSAKALSSFSNGALPSATPLFRTLSGFSRVSHILGGAVGAIFIPIDIGYLIYHSVEVANSSEHEFAKILRVEARKIDDTCPSDEDITAMLHECRVALISVE